MHYAGFWRRVAAYLIDSVIISVIGYFLGMLFGGQVEGSNGAMLAQVIFGILAVIYFIGFESSKYQGTLGKQIMKIKVTDINGNRIDPWRATGRYFAKIISALTLGIGYLMVAFTEKKQGLHDMIAKTLVIVK